MAQESAAVVEMVREEIEYRLDDDLEVRMSLIADVLGIDALTLMADLNAAGTTVRRLEADARRERRCQAAEKAIDEGKTLVQAARRAGVTASNLTTLYCRHRGYSLTDYERRKK